MGGFEDIDESILAGERIENEDIGTSANINPLKAAKRSIYVNAQLANAVLTGTSVALAPSGVFPSILFPNANSGTLNVNLNGPRGEVVPGETAKLHIFWKKDTATSGNIRLVIDITPIIEGASSLASAVNRAIISLALSGTTDIQEAIVDLPPAIFSNNQAIGLQIVRDPTNTLDTLASDIKILSIYLEINGRC